VNVAYSLRYKNHAPALYSQPSLQKKQEHAQALQMDRTWDQKEINFNQCLDLYPVNTILLKKFLVLLN
jgi:hypothetical protein